MLSVTNNIIMLNVVMLSVVMLNVVAPVMLGSVVKKSEPSVYLKYFWKLNMSLGIFGLIPKLNKTPNMFSSQCFKTFFIAIDALNLLNLSVGSW